MFNMNFLKDAKIVRVANGATAAQTTVTTSVVDTQGFNSVCFVAALGDVSDGSVLALTVKTNSANATTGDDVAAASTTAGLTADATSADNKMLAVDLNKPRQRYAFATLARGTANAVVDGVFAILYNAQEHPVTQDSSLVDSASLNDAA